ncbi:hypothetical protein RRG08_024462 [Elysia crispata]|uniref:Uncharacterized protein n=1 Tax=Elysia crispata TaxID=231223 RepID=A0AAE0YPL5_9GAST|nr:hypothetical protein RRG08_024462 [Elysia crispata]
MPLSSDKRSANYWALQNGVHCDIAAATFIPHSCYITIEGDTPLGLFYLIVCSEMCLLRPSTESLNVIPVTLYSNHSPHHSAMSPNWLMLFMLWVLRFIYLNPPWSSTLNQSK